MKIVPLSVAGGYWTGSSAFVDLLAEHSQCCVVPGEFTIFSFGQFFKEVYQPIINGRFDIELVENNLARFQAFNGDDYYPARAILRRTFRSLNIYPTVLFQRRSGLGKILGAKYQQACRNTLSLLKAFIESTDDVNVRELNVAIQQILEEAVFAVLPFEFPQDKHKLIIGVFDQLIAPPYEKYCRDALPDLRCINVDRDWRDQYISIRGAYKSMLRVNESLDVRPWDEENSKLNKMDPINYFIELRSSIDAMKKQQQNLKNTLWVQFEDLVNAREETAAKVFDFLGINPENWTPDICFHPHLSRKRIDKWKSPKWQFESLQDELQTISSQLDY